jgi:hypothetical protein
MTASKQDVGERHAHEHPHPPHKCSSPVYNLRVSAGPTLAPAASTSPVFPGERFHTVTLFPAFSRFRVCRTEHGQKMFSNKVGAALEEISQMTLLHELVAHLISNRLGVCFSAHLSGFTLQSRGYAHHISMRTFFRLFTTASRKYPQTGAVHTTSVSNKCFSVPFT